MMSTQLATELETPVRRLRRSYAVSALGPVTTLAGIVWAFVQPYRITLLDPVGQSFWSLAVEAPLLVMLVGVLFHFVVAPGLLADMADGRER
jgi:hypothetical protein